MRLRRILAVVGVAVLLVTAGCGSQAGDAGGGAGGGGGGAADGGSDSSGGDGGDGGSGDAARGAADGAQAIDANLQFRERRMIRTGEVELLVDDVVVAGKAVREMTSARGGFVSASNRRVHEANNETWRTETIVVRVPSESFDETIAGIEGLGEVQRAETDTKDVTDQLVDIEARLGNLRAERDRLRGLYDRANDTRDVLAVQEELSDVQEEIERLEARKQALERDVAYSTITIHLAEEKPDPEPTAESAWHEIGVIAAFTRSVTGVITVVRAIVVGAAYVAPYAIIFGIPILGVAAFYRRYFE